VQVKAIGAGQTLSTRCVRLRRLRLRPGPATCSEHLDPDLHLWPHFWPL